VIKLSLEVPAKQLGLVQAADLDFVLAHKVLEDHVYAEFFRRRPKGRELILDNSKHELGFSLPLADLITAADRVNPDYVIAPDDFNDPQWTVEQFESTVTVFNSGERRQKIAAVLVGDTPDVRQDVMKLFWNAPMLCLPYKKPRLEWWDELPRPLPWPRIHLLGVSSLAELAGWSAISKQNGTSFSVDTSKPVRWAMQGRRIDDGGSLRGGVLTAKALLDAEEMTAEQFSKALYNIGKLKEILA
jgi:hypothetical protein